MHSQRKLMITGEEKLRDLGPGDQVRIVTDNEIAAISPDQITKLKPT